MSRQVFLSNYSDIKFPYYFQEIEAKKVSDFGLPVNWALKNTLLLLLKST